MKTPGKRSLMGAGKVGLGLALLLLFFGDVLWAQGCSMCKSSLQGQSDAVINALKMGILVMLLPAVTIVLGIVLALRQSEEADAQPPAQLEDPSS